MKMHKLNINVHELRNTTLCVNYICIWLYQSSFCYIDVRHMFVLN